MNEVPTFRYPIIAVLRALLWAGFRGGSYWSPVAYASPNILHHFGGGVSARFHRLQLTTLQT